MSDLDEKLKGTLLEAIYKGVSLRKLDKIPEGSVNWFKAAKDGDVYEFVIDPEPIKQAFKDAGYVQMGYPLHLVEDGEYRGPLLSGKEFLARFEKEIAGKVIPYHGKTADDIIATITLFKEAARRAAGEGEDKQDA